MNEPTPIERVLDGHSEALGDMQKRLEAMERTVEAQKVAMRQFVADMHVEWRKQLVELAHDLRDDSDFARPFWEDAVDHVSDHLSTERGQKAIHSDGFTRLAEWWVKVQVKLIRSAIADWLLIVVLSAFGIAAILFIKEAGWLGKALGG